MRFQVPQFVDIEDKIIGPLTLKQFSFYLIAILILAPLYVLVDIGLLIALAVPILGVAALFAHGKFYGQSFGQIMLSALSYFTGERLFLWRRVAGAQSLKVAGEEYAGFEQQADQLGAVSLASMAQELNTEGNIVAADAADPLLEEGEEEAMAKAQRDDDSKNASPEASGGEEEDQASA